MFCLFIQNTRNTHTHTQNYNRKPASQPNSFRRHPLFNLTPIISSYKCVYLPITSVRFARSSSHGPQPRTHTPPTVIHLGFNYVQHTVIFQKHRIADLPCSSSLTRFLFFVCRFLGAAHTHTPTDAYTQIAYTV